MKKKIQGVTLLEIILVMVIGGSILLFSIQQYNAFRRDAEIRRLQNDVDVLFLAMAKYFRANCHTYFKNDASHVFPVTIADLKAEGYLIKAPDFSPFISYAKPAPEGYILQYNLYTLPGGALPTRTVNLSPAGSGTTSVGSIVIWQAQVAMNLNPATVSSFKAFKNALLADCLSSLDTVSGGDFVVSCNNAPPGATQFAVWNRLPSLASSKQNSPLWLTNPRVMQFRQLYTTDPITILTDPSQQNQRDNQYYLECGS